MTHSLTLSPSLSHTLSHSLSLSHSLQEDHSIEDYASISVDSHSTRSQKTPLGNIETLISKQFVTFNMNNIKKNSIKATSELQPYHMRLLNRISDTHVYGARSAMTIASYGKDWSLGGWYNVGVTSNNIGTEAGMKALTNSFTCSLCLSFHSL